MIRRPVKIGAQRASQQQFITTNVRVTILTTHNHAPRLAITDDSVRMMEISAGMLGADSS
jgi:hypothetical protein